LLPLLVPFDPDHCRYCSAVSSFVVMWGDGSPDTAPKVVALLGELAPGSLAVQR
jgi:hypothetical protein